MKIQCTILVFLSFYQVVGQFQSSINSPYNEDLSKELYTYSRIAFCPQDQIETWRCGVNCHEQPNVQEITVLQSSKLNIYGFSAYSTKHNSVILSFRGTSNLKNQIADGMFFKIKYPRCDGCLVHAGFYLGFQTIKEQMITSVKQILINHPGASFIVTGHSLGAAISIFAALEAQITFGNVKFFYNFGAPRVGNINFSNFINQKITSFKPRVVHNQDIFPHLPMRYLGFHHYGNEIFYNQDNSKYQVCDDSGEDPNCSNKFIYKYNTPEHFIYFNRNSTCTG